MSRVPMGHVVVLLSACVLMSCSTSEPSAEPKAAPSATASTSPSDTPSASPSATPTASPSVPEPGSMDEPATSSGPLSQKSFPTPKQLGRGWDYAVDPGDAEEGYSGNGTPALARSPQEIVQTAVPFGCARRTPMPAPTHALEVDYTARGAKAIAIRGQFADAATARTFFDGRAANLRACDGRVGSPAIGPLVDGIDRPAAGSLLSSRTPKSDPWREMAVLDGDSVVLLAVQGDDLAVPEARRLTTTFRR